MTRARLPMRDSFRVPNSIIQGLTTATPAELNRLPPFTMTTLLGLLGLVDPKHPEQEVRVRPRDILEIIEVGRTVAHAVDREWVTGKGERRRKRYPARRYNPKYLRLIQEALLELHEQKVVLQRWDPRGKVKLEDRVVHLLDMFGYSYQQGGSEVDIDDLPHGKVKVNVGTEERPVWRLRRRTTKGEQEERPSGVLFRLNKELAAELTKTRGTIGFTLVARRVFGVLRSLSREPGAIRLLLLVLRQTAAQFTRQLDRLLGDLGWDPDHRTRSLGQLEATLGRLKELRIVLDFDIDQGRNQVRVTKNQDWYQQGSLRPCQAG